MMVCNWSLNSSQSIKDINAVALNMLHTLSYMESLANKADPVLCGETGPAICHPPTFQLPNELSPFIRPHVQWPYHWSSRCQCSDNYCPTLWCFEEESIIRGAAFSCSQDSQALSCKCNITFPLLSSYSCSRPTQTLVHTTDRFRSFFTPGLSSCCRRLSPSWRCAFIYWDQDQGELWYWSLTFSPVLWLPS